MADPGGGIGGHVPPPAVPNNVICIYTYIAILVLKSRYCAPPPAQGSLDPPLIHVECQTRIRPF